MPLEDRTEPKQTNTGLYCQLHNAGFSGSELLLTQKIYRLCCELFNGRYRKTERAFLCHAVGTASSVANYTRDLNLIVVGMLHATYDSGHFPDGKSGMTKAHRAWMRNHVGKELECMVADYSEFDFGQGRPESLLREGIPEGDRKWLLIALSHEIDDMSDLGLAFAPKYGTDFLGRIQACAALANQLGEPALEAAIASFQVQYRDVAWVNPLASTSLRGFRMAPNVKKYLRLRRDFRRGEAVRIA